jgi:hypothetical protein
MKGRDRASLHSNLGAALYENRPCGRRTGRDRKGARSLLQGDGTPMQKSIAHAHLALLALDCDDMQRAERHARRSDALARRATTVAGSRLRTC